ncbi:HGL159Wp [Eremothecium sinecaudum]|uniref:aromatic-amino-acid transaminase n=1 Tax=Eremothecium sinecaudum TaxID=45286 RepID=A0A0X8HUV6_9SACH|nr:HGL159Wp [Eremothecium sinecaudum]AMD22181.1 HGL159Wp [Eremothecium sinecaudum]
MTLLDAKDFRSFFSHETRARRPSPLKSCIHYFDDPNIIFLAGGLPRSKFFPWDNLSVESPASLPDSCQGVGLVNTTVGKDDVDRSVPDIPLSRSLQYGYSGGQPELIKFLREHTKRIHNPQYNGWDITISIGNTSGWESTLRIFCDRGDTIIAERFTFSSSLEAALAQGVRVVPALIDKDGIIPESLAELLETWEIKRPGVPKPKLLYTVPTGQNPTGTCLTDERREAIYRIAQKHDFLIVEDEPYYFLQMELYEPDVSKRTMRTFANSNEFVNSLVKSFLSLDTEGRVIRLDSFSKVLAPGTRLGWVVGAKHILEAYLRLHEMTVQSPSGFSTSIVSGLLNRWGQEGYMQWLMKIRKQYTMMRDIAMDALHKYIPNVPFITINPTIAGMFFTITLDASAHPEFAKKYDCDPTEVESQLHSKMIRDGVLFAPGMWFRVIDTTLEVDGLVTKTLENEDPNIIFFRGTFAATTRDLLTEGIKRLGDAIRDEFRVE